MKNLAIGITSVFVCAAIFIGCSKEVVRTETCFDGILNNGETAIDCGGHCKPCVAAPSGPVIPPCTPTNNMVNFGSNLAASVSTSTASGQYEVTANTSNGDLYITFQNQPTVDRIYTVSSNCPTGSLGASECCMEFISFNSYVPAAGANVYVNIVGGVPVITYCSVVFSGSFTVTSTAKLTCP